VLPVVSRPLVMACLFTFCGIFLELPLSQLLYAPGSPPASIAIERAVVHALPSPLASGALDPPFGSRASGR
jgi:hypothetical protein